MARDTMHRTQISLEKWQYQYVMERAHRTQSSISDVIRRLIAEAVDTDMVGKRQDDSLFSVIGMADGDGQPAGREHDQFLVCTGSASTD